MASIDKLYLTLEQRNEFYAWCEQNYKPALRYFYPREDWEYMAQEDGVLATTNFPTEVDAWLLDNCTLGYIVEMIKDQYGIETNY